MRRSWTSTLPPVRPGVRLALALFALAGVPAVVSGAQATGAAPPAALEAGFDARVREVTLHNLLDFNSDLDGGPPSDAHFFRVRHRIWTKLKLRSGLSLTSRFVAEWRKYLDPYSNPSKTEIILDNFYLDVPRLPLLPVSLRIGRQDIIRGEGFVLLEGGPGDGSRSIFHNAVLLGFDGGSAGWRDVQVDLFAIRNMARDEFVVANDLERRLIENDETAFGLYVRSKELGHESDSYYIFKEEEGEACANPSRRVHTLGTRMTGDLPWNLKYAAEFAWQFGNRRDAQADTTIADHEAHGSYFWIKRSFLAPFNPEIKLSGVILSGDDPQSAADEGWHPVFARWPKWSELYIYSLIREQGRVADWTNLISMGAELGLQLSGSTRVTYAFQQLHAPERVLYAECVDLPCGSDGERGQLHIWKLTSQFSPAVSGHFLIERFAPGKAYASREDDAYFLRWELMIRK